ncbi:AraC family transcriptional regulator [Vibrio sp. SCSIO 43137]|uniref:AraC family transcriptional regulator n=1 Tax=Vibrio sp. SCSIO 43137 TaxID=3021011 RepID=UPI00230710A1|nr:AraC family transcriptional regulator [Vibrio sp. SCSIO 43137]WCE32463.1 AraC family transcriptional regulator [Vibrio sp. SCSIO 43137]
MNYAIEHRQSDNQHLVVTPRKKTVKHALLAVKSGLVLIRLGKNEYALQAGEAFWLPLDCLASVTYMPQTVCSEVTFSVRLSDNFSSQAGYIKLQSIASAAINKLQQGNISADYQSSLLQVLRFECAQLKPKLSVNALSEQISRWTENSNAINPELVLALKVREARKRALSGAKRAAIVDELFAGSEQDYENLSAMILGKAL